MTRRYWDACAFLGWLQREDGRVEGCGRVLREAEAGKIEIVTSALTIAEVLMLKGAPSVSKEKRQMVRDLFRKSWITLYQLDRTIAQNAQDVVWDHGVKPKDAVHVATALAARVDCLDTYDDGLLRRSKSIGTPGLVIVRPDVDGQLF